MPQQANLQDCGVFMLMAMERLTRDAALDFGQCDIPIIRKRIALDVKHGYLSTY